MCFVVCARVCDLVNVMCVCVRVCLFLCVCARVCFFSVCGRVLVCVLSACLSVCVLVCVCVYVMCFNGRLCVF